MWYYINVYGITSYLDNSNGTPDEQVWAHNKIQAISENTRLGIPVTFSSDRQYNAWGGMIDTLHDAFATAADADLASKLWKASIKSYIGEYATVVEDIEEADVVVADCTQYNDAAVLVIEGAKDAGKKLVIVSNCVDSTAYAMENGDAVLFMNFSRTADHGTGAAVAVSTTEPVIYADILFGVREPEGMIVKEIARNSAEDDDQWKNPAGDQGVDQYLRMIILALTENGETVPANWGDPLLGYQFGMRYGQNPHFTYKALVLPRVSKEVVTESSGSTMVSYESAVEAKSGVPFTVYALLYNNGADGVANVQVKDNDNVVAEKLMAVKGGSWRVVEIDVTLDTVGEHVITLGDLEKTINIAE